MRRAVVVESKAGRIILAYDVQTTICDAMRKEEKETSLLSSSPEKLSRFIRYLKQCTGINNETDGTRPVSAAMVSEATPKTTSCPPTLFDAPHSGRARKTPSATNEQACQPR